MGDYNDSFMRNNNGANVQGRVKNQNRAHVLQSKAIASSHPTGLTNNLLRLFEPRPPLEYKPPPEKNKCPPYSGIAQYVKDFAEPSNPDYAKPMEKTETPVRLVADKETNQPRGYAFVEYMHTRDMKAAYKQADGRKIDNRRVLVDVERGRTVPNWRPRRLGGGLGTTRVGGEEVNQKYSGRAQHQSAGPPRSEDPRVRDDCERDREMSRERGKARVREHDRYRERDYRDDRHQRDRERTRERDIGRDRTRDRDRGREREDRDRGHDKGRDRYREKERDRGRDSELTEDRGRSHDKDYDHDRVDSKLERYPHGGRGKSYDRRLEAEDNPGWSEQVEHGHMRSEFRHENVPYDYYEHGQSRGKYNPDGKDDYGRYEHHEYDHNRYDQMEEDNFGYDGAKSDLLDNDRVYLRTDMLLSRE